MTKLTEVSENTFLDFVCAHREVNPTSASEPTTDILRFTSNGVVIAEINYIEPKQWLINKELV